MSDEQDEFLTGVLAYFTNCPHEEMQTNLQDYGWMFAYYVDKEKIDA